LKALPIILLKYTLKMKTSECCTKLGSVLLNGTLWNGQKVNFIVYNTMNEKIKGSREARGGNTNKNCLRSSNVLWCSRFQMSHKLYKVKKKRKLIYIDKIRQSEYMT
jgi:hypothetical protein